MPTTKAPNPRDTLLCVVDLADRWKRKPKTIYNQLSAGTLNIPVIRLPPGNDPRFRLAHVLAAEAAWTTGAAICQLCNGSGQNPNPDEQCPRCHGTGWEPRDD